MRIRVNGIEIHYQLEGSPSAPAIILSHALAANLSIWEPQMGMLLQSYRVLRYDTRGHGESEVPPGPYTLEMLTTDVRALLQALGIARTYFMGISMGGMIGQRLALEAPEMLAGLILCDTTCQVPPEAGPLWDERIRTAETNGMQPHVMPTLERWFTPSFREKHPEIVERIGAMIGSTDPKGYIGCANAIRNLDVADRIRAIKMPVLILVGEDDPGAPVSASRAIQERIKGSELVVLKSASHLSNIEQHQAFNAAVSDFLVRVEHPASQ